MLPLKEKTNNPTFSTTSSGRRTFETKDENFQIPNPEKHKIISFIKSGVRIIGYCTLVVNIPIATAILFFSEIIGVIEEMV